MIKNLNIQLFLLIALSSILFVSCSKKNEVAQNIKFSLTDSIVLIGSTPSIATTNQGRSIPVADVKVSGLDKNKAGWQTITVSYGNKSASFNVFLANKIIANATDLQNALKTQKEGETWAIKPGEYALSPNPALLISNQDDYFKINKPNIHITGIADNGKKPTLYSNIYIANGASSTQNFITVGDELSPNTAEGFVLDGFTIMTKLEVNKVILVASKNCTIKNCDIKPNTLFNSSSYTPTNIDKTFAGSLYMNGDISGLVLENLNIEKGRISMSLATGSGVTMKNILIDYRGCVYENATDIASGFSPIYFPGVATFVNKTFDNVRIIASTAVQSAITSAENGIQSLTLEFK